MPLHRLPMRGAPRRISRPSGWQQPGTGGWGEKGDGGEQGVMNRSRGQVNWVCFEREEVVSAGRFHVRDVLHRERMLPRFWAPWNCLPSQTSTWLISYTTWPHQNTRTRSTKPPTPSHPAVPSHSNSKKLWSPSPLAHLREAGVRRVRCVKLEGLGEPLGCAPEGGPCGGGGVFREREHQLGNPGGSRGWEVGGTGRGREVGGTGRETKVMTERA